MGKRNGINELSAGKLPVGGGVRKRRGGMKRKRRKDMIFCIALVFLPMVQFAVFYVGVNLNSFLLAFKRITLDSAGNSTTVWVGFENFRRFLADIFTEDGILKYAGINSLIHYAVSLFINIPLLLLFAFYIYKRHFGHKVFQVVLYLPMIFSSLVMVISFSYFVDRAIPYLGRVLFGRRVAGLLSGEIITRYITILFYGVWAGFGSGLLMYASSMRRIPESVVEAARMDGCSPIREFFTVTIPLIYPTLSTFLIVSVPNIFRAQGCLFDFYSFSADPKLQTLGYYMYLQILYGRTSNASLPYASAGGLLLTAVAIPLTLGARWLLNRLDPEVSF